MHLTLGRDIVVPEEMSPHSLAPFVQLASAMREPSSTSLDSTLSIMQLSHAGRQSPRLLGGRPLLKEAVAPSAVAMQPREGIISGAFHRILFPTPREMTNEEISGLIEAFIRGALVAHETGFDGIQIHCSHGCGCICFRSLIELIESSVMQIYYPSFCPLRFVRAILVT